METKWTTRFWNFIVKNWKAVVAGISAVLAAILAVLIQKTHDEAKKIADDEGVGKEIEHLDDKKEIAKLEKEAELITDRAEHRIRLNEIDEVKKIPDKKERLKRLAEIANRG